MKITVFTPTYNRAYILNQLYQSLCRQTYRDFEWLIVDDGSTDDTEQTVLLWKEGDSGFPIRYYKQPNGGKCSAINRGLDLAGGELFFAVDSDDYLTDDALEKVNQWFDQIEPGSRIKGIVANKGYTPYNTENYIFCEEYLDMSMLDIYSFTRDGRKVLGGERACIFLTEFHRKYKYPVFPGEKFMTESVTSNRMAHDGYKMRFYNDIIWIFEYREDGLTKAGNRLFLENPKGYGLWLREKSEFLGESWVERLKMYYTFTCDLSDRLQPGEIADCIGAPYFIIAFFYAIRQILRITRKW